MKKRTKKFDKILVPNRGEIAVRIISACRELGISVVSAYSEPDRSSLHVQLADEAICVGGAPPHDSYLNIEAIVRAARETGCDAVHPGYGFLAENHRFAEALAEAGITFIGPSPRLIETMGSKIESRRIMQKAGVPIVPGTVSGSDEVDAVVAEAGKIEGPVFLKASAGGGGKGLRLVTDRATLRTAAKEAIGEARSAFGDGTIYVERQIDSPRHIEFQVVADEHGNVVHLFERECSIQRRHQKLLEETPSPFLDDKLRERMSEAAIEAARAVGYTNAGTVEFMVDHDKNFYFLEMNTRIQVEHPITEMSTGVDLVSCQIRIAQGERLHFRQEQVRPRGHAIECRIYAEDPRNKFLPSCGVIDYLREPSGPGIRNDSGVYQGWEVTPYYDPILSKLIAFAEDRDAARRRMLEALDGYVVHGIHTTVELHKKILTSSAFVEGRTDTSFLDGQIENWFGDTTDVPDEAFIAAALADLLGHESKASSSARNQVVTPWRRIGKWEIGGA